MFTLKRWISSGNVLLSAEMSAEARALKLLTTLRARRGKIAAPQQHQDSDVSVSRNVKPVASNPPLIWPPPDWAASARKSQTSRKQWHSLDVPRITKSMSTYISEDNPHGFSPSELAVLEPLSPYTRELEIQSMLRKKKGLRRRRHIMLTIQECIERRALGASYSRHKWPTDAEIRHVWYSVDIPFILHRFAVKPSPENPYGLHSKQRKLLEEAASPEEREETLTAILRKWRHLRPGTHASVNPPRLATVTELTGERAYVEPVMVVEVPSTRRHKRQATESDGTSSTDSLK